MSPATPARPASIELVGRQVTLDLINTVSWRGDSTRWRDNLARPADLLTWCHRTDLLNQQTLDALRTAMTEDPSMAKCTLRKVRDLRECLHDHLTARIANPNAPQQIRRGTPLHRAFTEAIRASDLGGTPGRWQLDIHRPTDIPRLLALHALDLLQTAPLQRLRRCDDGGCGWLFLDTTRNHSRRWCSSAECGNRDRARRHYARTHKETS